MHPHPALCQGDWTYWNRENRIKPFSAKHEMNSHVKHQKKGGKHHLSTVLLLKEDIMDVIHKKYKALLPVNGNNSQSGCIVQVTSSSPFCPLSVNNLDRL